MPLIPVPLDGKSNMHCYAFFWFGSIYPKKSFAQTIKQYYKEKQNLAVLL